MSDALEIRFESVAGARLADVGLRGAKALNLVDEHILRDAAAAFASLAATPDLRCVLLHGQDQRAFVGGANLAALHALDAGKAESFIRAVHEFCAALRQAPVPVIAVMQGFCLGAGLEIAAACDIRIGDHSVRCGMPEVRVGVPSVVEAALLPGLIGWGKARELMLRGHIIDAGESRAVGLLQHLVDTGELSALAHAIAADIAAGTPGAIAAQKALFLSWEDLPVSLGIERGVDAFVRAYEAGDEPQRAIAAFFAGRGKPLP
ncbi:MAG: enoyl-CoA hydratase/isomerase family protein [Gammaproteobacteria bacterium]|nr:enoyl-CoA hydratase/isomerase family protein [Gammaproteobacteria bacterium]MCP5198574.1 enoyl-CoA hydratase/isomerase family protein [Gammaproteobacteria bacterium]